MIIIQFCLPRDYYDSNSCCFHYFVAALVRPLEHCLSMTVIPNVGDSFVSQFDWICSFFSYLYRFFVWFCHHQLRHHHRRLHHHPDWSCLFLWSCLPYLRCTLFDCSEKWKFYGCCTKMAFKEIKTIAKQLNSIEITWMSMVHLGPICIVLAM